MATISGIYSFELYLEGVVIDFDACGISITTNGINANFQVPYNNYIKNIIPNTKIHLFFSTDGDKTKRLLFDGRVLGISLNNSNNFMSASLQCTDISGYIDQFFKYFINDQNFAEMQVKTIAHYGASEENLTPVDGATSANRFKNIIKGQDSIINILYAYVEDTVKKNIFMQRLQSNEKFTDRFYHINDEQESQIISQKIGEQIISRMPFSNLATFRDIINSISRLIYYEASYINTPYYSDGKVKQVIYKPDNFFIPPPMCNVVFPNMISSFSWSRSFMVEPTRLALRGKDLLMQQDRDKEVMQYIAYSPPKLKEIAGDSNILSKALIDDEVHKGIIPLITEVPNSTWLQGADFFDPGRTKGDNASYYSLNEAANYILQKRQSEGQSMNSGASVFNPYLCVNYPGAVIKHPVIVFGKITGINHTINAGGSISTSFSMSNCRISDIDLDSNYLTRIKKLKESSPFNWSTPSMSSGQEQLADLLGEQKFSYPSWLNVKYKPSQIDETYNKLFGCSSIMSASSNPNSTGLTENARILYNQYKDIYESKGIGNFFTSRTTQRPIIKLTEFFDEFLGLSRVNSNQYSASTNSYFDSDRQNIVLQYNKGLSRNSGKFN